MKEQISRLMFNWRINARIMIVLKAGRSALAPETLVHVFALLKKIISSERVLLNEIELITSLIKILYPSLGHRSLQYREFPNSQIQKDSRLRRKPSRSEQTGTCKLKKRTRPRCEWTGNLRAGMLTTGHNRTLIEKSRNYFCVSGVEGESEYVPVTVGFYRSSL